MRIAHNSKFKTQNSKFLLWQAAKPITKSVSAEDVARVDFVFHVLQAIVEAVGDNGMTLGFKLFEVVYNFATEEGGAVLKGWLVDDDLGSLCLDALHDALDG